MFVGKDGASFGGGGMESRGSASDQVRYLHVKITVEGQTVPVLSVILSPPSRRPVSSKFAKSLVLTSLSCFWPFPSGSRHLIVVLTVQSSWF